MNDMIDLEQSTLENVYYTFDPECVRKRSNMSKSSDSYKFDHPSYKPESLLSNIATQSPKLHKLLEKIRELDKGDMDRDEKLYKHFIFCDLKSNSYGAKLLASALIASGKTLGYYAKMKRNVEPNSNELPKQEVREDTPRPSDKLSVKRLPKSQGLDIVTEDESEENLFEGGSKKFYKKKKYEKIEFLDREKLHATKYENFFLLSSVDVYDQTITIKDKKHILQTFNQRPDNIYGENIRFIIMDSGFKEGIDLFDIKYIHIFEPPVNGADKKQVIGRGTRTCGQKGLIFHPTKGWPLHVYMYDLEIPGPLQKQFSGLKTTMELYLQSLNVDIRQVAFGNDLETTVVYGSVDHDLNRAIHSFQIDDAEIEDQIFGGGPKRTLAKKLVVDSSKPVLVVGRGGEEIVLPSGQTVIGMELSEMSFDKMREYVHEYFSHCSWKDVKMENQCVSNATNVAQDSVIQYTPTQRFIQEYFTPQAPVKGMLLWHSVGTGKTCSAIASATASFVPQGYTILWVTRTTLKNDIWKNMFDQICNEQIRKMVRDGVELPKDHNQRMRLLSKAWKIRPMSYKQFSNLVSKENDLYRKLTQINGSQDPLRKTLLVIDEAHKLYGGGDLSSLERPDMKALHKALMNSYAISGRDSARVLLMTATPITEKPMELIQLINLCKKQEDQIPDDFDGFSATYLNDQGRFSRDGRAKFLDDTAGYVSYLNREKDARQFAQPEIHTIHVPMIEDVKEVEKMDRRYYRSLLMEDIDELKEGIEKENAKIDSDLQDLHKTRFYAIKDVCEEYEGKVKKTCEKIANKNIKMLIAEIKAITSHIKDAVKVLKTDLKDKKVYRKDALIEHKKGLQEMSAEDMAEFKTGSYYMLKYKCGKKTTENIGLQELANKQPEIEDIDRQILVFDERRKITEERITMLVSVHKKKVKELKDIMRKELSELERSVVKSVLKDAMKEHRKSMKETRKDILKENVLNKRAIKVLRKTRKKYVNKLNKELKSQKRNEKSRKKETERQEKALRKTLRKQGELRSEFKGDFMKSKVQEYQKITETEFGKIRDELIQAQEAKVAAIAKKAEEREIKRMEKVEKAKAKEIEKAEKAQAKVEKAKTKGIEKEEKAHAKVEKAKAKGIEKERKNTEKEARRKEKSGKMTRKKRIQIFAPILGLSKKASN